MESIKDKIRKLIKKLKKKKYSTFCWYTTKGKLLYCGSKNEFHAKLNKNKNKFNKKYIIEVQLDFNINKKDKESKLKNQDDLILITAIVRLVNIKKLGTSLSKRT